MKFQLRLRGQGTTVLGSGGEQKKSEISTDSKLIDSMLLYLTTSSSGVNVERMEVGRDLSSPRR